MPNDVKPAGILQLHGTGVRSNDWLSSALWMAIELCLDFGERTNVFQCIVNGHRVGSRVNSRYSCYNEHNDIIKFWFGCMIEELLIFWKLKLICMCPIHKSRGAHVHTSSRPQPTDSHRLSDLGVSTIMAAWNKSKEIKIRRAFSNSNASGKSNIIETQIK